MNRALVGEVVVAVLLFVGYVLISVLVADPPVDLREHVVWRLWIRPPLCP